jgi:hypothetical protein
VLAIALFLVVARHIEPLRLALASSSTHYAEADVFSASSLFLAAIVKLIILFFAVGVFFL